MTKRVYKYQVIDKLYDLNYIMSFTLRKTCQSVNGINQKGWFVSTLHGWEHLGDTLALAMRRLELEQEEEENLTEAQLDERLVERHRETKQVADIAIREVISIFARLGH